MQRCSISGIMANYNHGKYIGEAIESFIDQSFKPTELVIVDDGSTDNSLKVIEQYSERSDIVKLYKNKQNRGAGYAAQKAFDYSIGEYITAQSADDKVLPNFLEKSMQLLSKYPQAGLCCSDPATFNHQNGIISANKLCWNNEPCYLSPDRLAGTIAGGYIAGHTSIVKKSALIEAGGYIPDLKWHCDWFALLVVAFRHGICYIPEPLAALRVGQSSYSSSGRKDWSQQSKVLDKILCLLKSPAYRDVLPYFARSNVLSHFGNEIVRVVMENPKHWDMETHMLIQHPLWRWNEQLKNKQNKPMIAYEMPTSDLKILNAFKRGNAILKQGRIEDAFHIFFDLTQKYPDHKQSHLVLAKIAAMIGKLEIFNTAAKKALELDPNDSELHNQIGMAYFRIGEYDKARWAFKKAVALDPYNHSASTNLATMP